MGFKKTVKGDDATEIGAGTPTPSATDTAAADAVAVNPAPVIEQVPDAIPQPIIATDADGAQRPQSGGSFIRQSDGTLTRNLEA